MSDPQTQTAPTSRGDPYCGACGYSLKGLEDSARCPECGRPIVEVLMRREFAGLRGRRYRSKAMMFGLPVIDVAIGPWGNETRGRAKAVIAIGDLALGWLAIGGVARGIFAVGGVSLGIFAIGGLSMGVVSAVGGMALALGLATGGFALGGIACGGLAVGIIAQGGLALGMYAAGGLARGAPFPPGFERLKWIIAYFPPKNPLDVYRPMLTALVPMIVGPALIGLAALFKLRGHVEWERET